MKKHTTSIIIGIAVIVIAILLYSNLKDAQTVEVIGNSLITVPPDQVLVYLQIQTKASTAEEAKNKNSEITNNVISSLKTLGLSPETENYNIYQEYDYSRNKITGYSATNYIKVKTDDFDLTGKIIDSSVNAGALVNYINFELSTEKSNEIKKDALTEASKDAKSKAEAIAQGLDKKLGSLVSISTSDYNYIPYPLLREGSSQDAKTVTVDIQPRNLDVTATVKAVYKIK